MNQALFSTRGLAPECALNSFLKQNFLQLRPELIIEHQSEHRKLVLFLLMAWEPQYYDFSNSY